MERVEWTVKDWPKKNLINFNLEKTKTNELNSFIRFLLSVCVLVIYFFFIFFFLNREKLIYFLKYKYMFFNHRKNLKKKTEINNPAGLQTYTHSQIQLELRLKKKN